MPMSSVIPKGQQTAYQRWEMTSFGDARPSQMERQQEAARVSLAEIEAIKDQARQQAYAEGYKEAYEAGFNQGRDAGYAEMQVQAETLVAHLEGLVEQFKQQLDQASDSVGTDLIQLAISLASSMTKRQFAIAPEAINDIVREAIELLPSVHQPAIVYLHPEDLELLKELSANFAPKEVWRLQADATLSRGGCRIETAQNTIDASYETRWQKLTDRILGIDLNSSIEPS